MADTSAGVLNDPVIRVALGQAWQGSQPGESGGHEEGGFILQDANGDLSVLRWPSGTQNSIVMPSYAGCKIGASDIVATFHTHPNLGEDYLQEPGETDKSSVRDDPDLKGEFYEGEFVISQAVIYLITPDGRVSSVAQTDEIFRSQP